MDRIQPVNISAFVSPPSYLHSNCRPVRGVGLVQPNVAGTSRVGREEAPKSDLGDIPISWVRRGEIPISDWETSQYPGWGGCRSQCPSAEWLNKFKGKSHSWRPVSWKTYCLGCNSVQTVFSWCLGCNDRIMSPLNC